MLKIDLHTHSTGSPDGGISLAGYRRALREKKLDYIAITDHNTISRAQKINTILGDRIIVGEEIMTTHGELIGLYLTKLVKPHQSPAATVKAIKQQGGLVLVPHPFESIRKGLSAEILKTIIHQVDIIEIRNGRALLQNRMAEARAWARLHDIAGAASSDAHSYFGVGRTYSEVAHKPTVDSLVHLLSAGRHTLKGAKLPTLLAPKFHRLRKRLGLRRP